MEKKYIALAGNPNSGKTTLFNALTGANQYVGNWPGVTVEKKEGHLKKHPEIILQDLPGVYSLSPYTPEEVVTRNYLIVDKPDLILNLVDASNLERNLYLTTQLLETGIPVIIALNMMDVVNKRGDVIDTAKLATALGCPIIEISALKSNGLEALTDTMLHAIATPAKATQGLTYDADIEAVLNRLADLLPPTCPPAQHRWFAGKLFERDEKVLSLPEILPIKDIAEPVIRAYEESKNDDSESLLTDARYRAITALTSRYMHPKSGASRSLTDRIDSIVTNRWLGLPIFAFVMWAVYYISIQTVGAWGTDWANDTLFGELVPEWVGNFLTWADCSEWVHSLVLDGIVAGVGAVLGFLPQMAVLFICLGILEDCGYMSRVAFILDRIFRKFGLSGKSFIPMLVSMGCGVPGIMATRTIENEKDRRMTIMTTTFIPCGAKTPIIALIAGAFFPENSWVAPGAYFIGVAAIILSGLILKKTALFSGDTTPFVMEMPNYHLPQTANVLMQAWTRCKSFARKAGTIIFAASVIIWSLSTYNWQWEPVESNSSMLADVGGTIAPVFQPLGWGDWKPATATITGLIAKENVVGTMGVLFAGNDEETEATATEATDQATEEAPAEEEDEEEAEIRATGSLLAASGAFTPLTAFSFMIFNLLCAPCFAAIGAIRREMNSGLWTSLAIGYMCLLAYVISYLIYQLGLYFCTAEATFTVNTGIALALLLSTLYLIFKPTAKQPTKH